MNKELRTFRESHPAHHPEDFIHRVEVAAEDVHHPVEEVAVQGPAEVAGVRQGPVATDRKRILIKINREAWSYTRPLCVIVEKSGFFIHYPLFKRIDSSDP